MSATLDQRRAHVVNRIGLGVGAVMLLVFGAYCAHVVRDVTRLRGELEACVGQLMALQALHERLEHGDAAPAAPAFDPRLPAPARAAAERAYAAAAARSTAEATAAIDTSVAAIRRANRGISQELGAYWDALNLLAALALGFAAATLLLAFVARRTALRLRGTKAQLEDRLQDTERGLARLIEAVPSGVLVHRAERILYANPAMEQFLGASRGALLDTRLTDHLDDADTDGPDTDWPDTDWPDTDGPDTDGPDTEGPDTEGPDTDAADPAEPRAEGAGAEEGGAGRVGPSGGLTPGERTFRRSDGATRRLEIDPGPTVPFGDGTAEVAVVRDVSERRLVESQLRLADRLAAVGSVTAGIAHEINNPLTFVLTNAQLLGGALESLALEGPAADSLRELTADIVEGARRVRDVVGGLRTLSHPADEAVRAVAVPELVHSSVAIASSELSQRARVRLELTEGLPRVRANETQVGQVLLNILVNAAQAYPEDARHGEIVVRAFSRGTRVCVEIADDGPGMDAATQARVFEPFFTTKPVGQGTGLGLAICRRIVEQLGGEIELDSAPGRGTRVRVCLQVAAEDAPAEPAERETGGAEQALRVLVIDDEPRVARSLGRLLREHACEAASGGAAGLARLAEDDFDVIFCDLMMPEVTGMDVHEALVREGRGRERRLVLVTGGAFTERARAFVAGSNVVVVEKPFDGARLREAVRQVRARAPGRAAASRSGEAG